MLAIPAALFFAAFVATAVRRYQLNRWNDKAMPLRLDWLLVSVAYLFAYWIN